MHTCTYIHIHRTTPPINTIDHTPHTHVHTLSKQKQEGRFPSIWHRIYVWEACTYFFQVRFLKKKQKTTYIHIIFVWVIGLVHHSPVCRSTTILSLGTPYIYTTHTPKTTTTTTTTTTPTEISHTTIHILVPHDTHTPYTPLKTTPIISPTPHTYTNKTTTGHLGPDLPADAHLLLLHLGAALHHLQGPSVFIDSYLDSGLGFWLCAVGVVYAYTAAYSHASTHKNARHQTPNT
jgi:hypothetical protein